MIVGDLSRAWYSANVSGGTPMGPLIEKSVSIAAELGLAGTPDAVD